MVMKLSLTIREACRTVLRWRVCGLLLAAACSLPCAAADPAPPRASPVPTTLVVAMDDNYPPYVFRDSTGALTGYLVDYWRLWQTKTGVSVDLQASDWDLAKQRMQSRQASVIDTIFQTPEREKTLDFTPPYARIPVSIYTHTDIGGIASLDNLTGFQVGVKTGDACVDTLNKAGIQTLQPYPNYETLVRAAIAGQVKIFCLDEPPANYLLYREHAEGTFNKAFQLDAGAFHRAVHKGDGATMALLLRGFAAISESEDQALRNKWMGTRLVDTGYGHILGVALLATIVLGLWLLLWSTVLRRRVHERTAELDAERARLRVLLETIPNLVWMKDLAGVYRYCNPMFERYFGTREAQIVGKTDHDFVDRSMADRFRENDLRAIAAGGPTINEEWITFADDGHTALLETTKTPVYDAAGDLAGVLGIARDVTLHKQVEQALQDSENRLHTILDSVEAHIYIKDTQYRYQYVNKRVLGFFNLPQAAILNQEDFALFDAQTAAMVRANDSRVIEGGERVALEETVTRNGEVTTHYSVKLPLRDKDGHIYALCGISTDITEQKELETSLRISATAFESQEGMLITDANSVILRINQSFANMSGYTAQEVIGRTPRMFSSNRHGAEFYAAMWHAINTTGQWQGEIWDRRKNGEVYPAWMALTAVKGEDGVVTNYVATHTDITERKTSEEQIRHLAFFDPLTSLPNRRLLGDRLQQALASSSRTLREGALLFIDLDHFKTLNDTLGHDVGDLLLREVAGRITRCVRDGDTVARLGGDEFVVMLENLSENNLEAASQAEAVGDKILTSLCLPYDLDSREYRSSASIGLTLFDATHNTSEDLMKRADLAMYQAKAAGRNNLRFFDPRMQAEITQRAALEVDLRQGIQLHQFVLHYQTQVNVHNAVTGVEALVRWQHPLRGLVPPVEFIPLAEETGLILPLGNSVLRTACAQLAAWANQPALAHLSIAVNVSARQFHQDDFVEEVLASLQAAQANPQRLKLELTESLLVSNIDATVEKMLALKAHGVRFSLDDFGTGYSSLSYLKRLPLDQLKIDQGFVRDILVDANDATIAKTVVALAESMGLKVIAEGVETEAQRQCLAELGCHAYQGYLFGRPMPIAELEEFLGRQEPRYVE